MKCPICGETTILPQVAGDFCPACGESVLDEAESRRTMNLMLKFNKAGECVNRRSGIYRKRPQETRS